MVKMTSLIKMRKSLLFSLFKNQTITAFPSQAATHYQAGLLIIIMRPAASLTDCWAR
jgi:hypothetical protein